MSNTILYPSFFATIPHCLQERSSRQYPSPIPTANKPETIERFISPADADFEGHTWRLDILLPTDKETKMLSKEEAREEIELFRIYYLACFRSNSQNGVTWREPRTVQHISSH
ncbi:hypothetical protein BJY52DRAFT_1320756 [Lactarius psammicola]|nr:hypothetical protein BJY52DRAFT_1320756 [Lactarius psammicola]